LATQKKKLGDEKLKSPNRGRGGQGGRRRRKQEMDRKGGKEKT